MGVLLGSGVGAGAINVPEEGDKSRRGCNRGKRVFHPKRRELSAPSFPPGINMGNHFPEPCGFDLLKKYGY